MPGRTARLLASTVLAAAIGGGCALAKKHDAGSCDVVIGAASSLSAAMSEMRDGLAESALCDGLTFTHGSSGSLAAQVANGAPIDVLVVAGSEPLVAAGLDPSRSTALVSNSAAILLSPAAAAAGSVASIADLVDPDLVVGLCTADAPCGSVADEVLGRAAALFDRPGLSRAIADTEAANADDLVTKVAMGEIDAAIGWANACATNAKVTCLAIPPSVDGSPLGATIDYRIAVVRESGAARRVVAAMSGRAFIDRLVADFGFIAP